ncbi:MAG: hypothetical protein HUU10_08500 [Bacteroidetes bacterium]|nr:hypothetical protein [Bacteroidota bacterium]
MGRVGLKSHWFRVSLWLLSGVLLLSCERDELDRSDLDLQIQIVSPDPSLVVTADTLRVRLKLIPDDSLRFDELTIDGIRPVFKDGGYECLLNLSGRGKRIPVPIKIRVDGQVRYTDSLRLVKFTWQSPVLAGHLTQPRANHATILHSNDRLLTSGGVSGYYDPALKSTEYFSLLSGSSDSLPSWNLLHARAGHAMVSVARESFMVLGGMTSFRPGQAGNNLLPTELVYQFLHTVLDTSDLTADFAWSQSGSVLLTHGGWNSDYTGRFVIDSHSITRTSWKRTGYQLALHSLTPMTATPGLWFLASGDFSWNYPLMYSFYLGEDNGALYPSDLFFRIIRLDHTATALPGNFILIAGGLQNPGPEERLVEEIELSDLNRGRSYRLPGKLLTARAAHTAVAAGSFVYFLGGLDANRQVLSSIEKMALE